MIAASGASSVVGALLGTKRASGVVAFRSLASAIGPAVEVVKLDCGFVACILSVVLKNARTVDLFTVRLFAGKGETSVDSALLGTRLSTKTSSPNKVSVVSKAKRADRSLLG